MARLIIEGIKSTKVAKAVAEWYEKSGEEYCTIYLDRKKIDAPMADTKKEIKEEGEDIVLFVK